MWQLRGLNKDLKENAMLSLFVIGELLKCPLMMIKDEDLKTILCDGVLFIV